MGIQMELLREKTTFCKNFKKERDKKRITKNHDGPYGSHCELDIVSEDELLEDDMNKLKEDVGWQKASK